MPFGAGVAGCSLRGTVGENATAVTEVDVGCERHRVAAHTAPTHSSTRSEALGDTPLLYTRRACACACANEERKTKNEELKRGTANREPSHSVLPFFRRSVVPSFRRSEFLVLVFRSSFFVLRITV
jgi:hypothetical protein